MPLYYKGAAKGEKRLLVVAKLLNSFRGFSKANWDHMAKPFVKWAGGKGKLLLTLERNLPEDFYTQDVVTYVEPFVGGGAMLFYMLSTHPNIRKAIINDINPALINCYRTIQTNHVELINELEVIERAYYWLFTHDDRRFFYNELRKEYNSIPVQERTSSHAAALFIFFNKTGFNGLYRENSKGEYNVPYGKYAKPTICNKSTIIEVHEALQNVEILQGDYAEVLHHVSMSDYSLFYLDPPYRPLSGKNSFNQYTLNAFGDAEQEQLKVFCDELDKRGIHFLLSNSDSESEPGVSYFENLYHSYHFQRIDAPRTINAFVPGVQKVKEVLIKNYGYDEENLNPSQQS